MSTSRILRNSIRFWFCVLPIALPTSILAQEKQADSQFRAEALKTLPFTQHVTTDKFNRNITFYLSRWPLGREPVASEQTGSQPLIVFINGSGAQSVFARFEDKVSSGLQGLLLRAAKGRARVMVVEKPGSDFLDETDRPGSAIGAKPEFLREHTLDRWAAANIAAIEACWKMPDIDKSKSLVLGHSEGGGVAARVAAELHHVTHVACLARGGASQLFSLAQLAAKPQPGDKPGDANRRRQAIYDGWAEVQKDPDSTEKFWLGHPHRRWSSFLPQDSTADLLRSKAKIYLVHGTADSAEDPAGHEYAVATLRTANREVSELLIERADHGFNTPDTQVGSPEGFSHVFARIVDWFGSPSK